MARDRGRTVMTGPGPLPPRLGRLILRFRPLGSRRHEVEDDLRELFEARARTKGLRHASFRYVLDACSLWRWGIGPSLTSDTARSPQDGRSAFHDVVPDIVFAVRMFARQPAVVLMTVAGLSL